MKKGSIIYLNGVTSTGKSSVAEKLREHLDFYYLSDDIFEDNPLFVVDVHCPLEICRQRNLTRGDRHEHQSREQAAIMAKNVRYDLHLDTSILTPDQCARKIVVACAL